MPGAPDSVSTIADDVEADAEVRVELRIVVPDRAEFVAVDDPLPAGLEAVNTRFLTNQSSLVMTAETADGWWSPFNHMEMRDDRVTLFADRLPVGVYTHTYVARATTKGTFQVSPAHALETYEPENFGRTASTVVEVR